MLERVASSFSSLVSLVLPSPCLVCGLLLDRPLFGPVCAPCLRALPPLDGPGCPRCGVPYANGVAPGLCGPCRSPRRAFRRARAAGPYEGALKELLHRLKFDKRVALGRSLGELAYARCVAGGPLEGAVAVPVPLHFWRRRARGYNQADLLARSIARAASIPLCRALLKVKDRPPQTSLSLEARRRNARGAYRARRRVRLAGRSVLLVDDVFTTGATADACARALRRAGASAVDVVTVARVLLG